MTETTPGSAEWGGGWALAAYAVIFVAFFGYVAFLHVSQRRLRARLDELERSAGGTRPRG